jgi:hypothetical protein
MIEIKTNTCQYKFSYNHRVYQKRVSPYDLLKFLQSKQNRVDRYEKEDDRWIFPIITHPHCKHHSFYLMNILVLDYSRFFA